jgi:hypothetical protein
MSNSAFTPTVLTVAGTSAATSGEKNYILSPDDNSASRWVTSDAAKITIATSSSTIPDNITKTTSLAVTRVSGTDGYARYRFTLDQADYGKKFKISWDQIYATAAHWTLEVYSNTSAAYTGTSTKLTVATSSVPGITGTFVTSVDMSGSAAPYIEVRLIGSSASATTIYLNNVLVGPGTIVQGAAISEWQNESSPSSRFSGLNSLANSSPYYRWRRNGSNIEILAGFTLASTDDVTGELAVTLPTGYSINTALLVSSIGSCGEAFAVVAGSNYNATAVSTSSGFVFKGHAASSNWNATVPANWASGNIFHTRIEAPVNEFSGSGTVNLGPGAQVEYASNNGSGGITANTDYNTGSVAGPFGSNFVAVAASTTGSTGYKVTFQYPIQQDETIVIELSGNSGVNWSHYSTVALTDRFYLGGVQYGMWVDPIDSTSVYVRFGNGGRYTTNTSIGITGAPWSDLTSTYRWRVRKAKASAPVGFGKADSSSFGLVGPRRGQYSLTVTSSLSGFSTVRAVGIYYQDQDGNHRLKFNINGTFTSTTYTSSNTTVSGVTFKNGPSQSISAMTGGSSPGSIIQAYANSNASTLTLLTTSGTSVSSITLSGDVELESKPSWA